MFADDSLRRSVASSTKSTNSSVALAVVPAIGVFSALVSASCVAISGTGASIAVLDPEVVLVASFTIASLSVWIAPLLVLLLLFVVDSV